MILYELICSAEHRFEAWFRDSAAFDKQRKARAVGCPVCGDLKVRKAIMAPALARTHKGGGDVAPADKDKPGENRQRQMTEIATQLREHVEKNCDYVGDSFPEEARRIHYGEAETRGIYGEATETEARELKEEGVPVGRLPFVSRRDD